VNSGGLIVIALLFALFWLFLIRPQRRRQAEQERMLAGLEVGDEVVTAGGIYGDVVGLEEDEVRLEIAPGTEVRVARRAIAAVLEDDDEDDEDEEADTPDEEQVEPPADDAGAGRDGPTARSTREREG
jgi:preprotein translocase subunit YajC